MDESTTEQKSQAPEATESRLSMPVAIVIAGLLIAGSIYLSRGASGPSAQIADLAAGNGAGAPQEIPFAPISNEDHLLGNPDAPIVAIEYSDLECPFCKTFHVTMRSLMDEFGRDGKMAWAYRHFPLTQIHPKAQREAEAVECVASLTNGTATWNFINKIFETTPANNQLAESALIGMAKDLGVDGAALTACLDSGEKKDLVAADLADALRSGGRGTPYTVLSLKEKLGQAKQQAITQQAFLLGAPDAISISADGKVISVSGAMPLQFMKELVTTILE